METTMEQTTVKASTAAGTERLNGALKACKAVLKKAGDQEAELNRLRELSGRCATEIVTLEATIDPADQASVQKLWMLGTQRKLADAHIEELSQTKPVAEVDAAAALESAKLVLRENLRPLYSELEAAAIHAALLLTDGEAAALQLVRSTAKFQWLSRTSNAEIFGFAADVPAVRKAAAALEVIASGQAESLLAWPVKP